jgi:hypothetical protein
LGNNNDNYLLLNFSYDLFSIKKGYDNGLKSVLTTSLTMSILGYPFILPDMIGINKVINIVLKNKEIIKDIISNRW